MSTFLVVSIVTGTVVAICVLLVSIDDKHKHEAMNKILNHFSKLGTENNLSFSSQEILHNCILGVDGVQRKILVVTRENNYYGSFIIDINKIKECTVKKIYGTIEAGDLEDHKLDQYLERIVLYFELHDKPPVEITFYENFDNNASKARELDQKARYWKTILLKMQKPSKNITCQPVI